MGIFASPRFWFLAVFITAVAFVLWWDRNKIQRHSILFFRRTKKGVQKIQNIASSLPEFWNWYGWIGAVAGLISIPFITYQLGTIVFDMAAKKSAEGGPSLILPGLVSENNFQAGVSFIPVEYWIIGISILLVVHELSHGIVASNEGFEINSVGWIVLGIIPGAFVEPKGEQMLPDEDHLSSERIEEEKEAESGGMWDQGDWISRLKVLAAGSWANYITAGVFILIALGLSSAVTQPGSVIYAVEPGFPANNSGMDNGTMYAINGQRINTVDDVRSISDSIKVGDNVTIWSSEGNFTLQATEKEDFDGGYIGIRFGETTKVKSALEPYEEFLQWLLSLLFTVSALNIGIGLFNMVPAKPLDGGHMVDTLLERFAPNQKKYMREWSFLVWAGIVAMILVSLFG